MAWAAPIHDSIVASRIASCASRAVRQLRDGVDGRLQPQLRVGGDRVHRAKRRGDERGDRVAPRLERVDARDESGTGQRRDVVDAQEDDRLTGELELDRLVVGEPGRGVDGSLLDGGTLREVRVFDDLDVLGRQSRRPRSAWSMTQPDP